jgi:rhodanese-related sulfurtransferase
MIPTVNVQQLKEQLERNQVLLVDVRQPAEYRSEHIQGAYLLPLDQVSSAQLPQTPKPIVFYCRSGQRSGQATSRINSPHSTRDVYSLEGGIVAWMAQGYPVVQHHKTMMPVDRQTQITIGSLILVGLVLGRLWSPWGYGLSAVMGAGLIIAGLTGWCGMAKWLATMPWNQ